MSEHVRPADFSVLFPDLGVVATAVLTQGREVSTHIIRMNLIMAELYADEDQPICEHCGSMDVLTYKNIEPEYRDAGVSHYEINSFGTQPVHQEWKDRRDRIETRQGCNFCSYTISLGFEWSDWYKVQDFSIGTVDKLIVQTTGTTTGEDFIWSPNTTLGMRTFTIDCSEQKYGYSMGCNTDGTRWNK